MIGSMLVLFDFAPHLLNFWITAFHFAPLVGLLTCLFAYGFGPTDDVVQGKIASDTAIKLYSVFAIIFTALYFYTLYLFYNSSAISLDLFLSPSSSSPLSTSVFLCLDGLGLSIALGFLVLVEDGLFTFVEYFGLSLLLGPGAAFLVLAIKREQSIMKQLIHLAKGDKKSKSE